jgi:hypothetical protein
MVNDKEQILIWNLLFFVKGTEVFSIEKNKKRGKSACFK